jgi:uncharacterized protein with GYD domain
VVTYIILMNLTEKGITNIKDAPARIKESAKALEAAGGRLLGFYLTLGQYDYVAIAEGPSDKVGMLQLLGIGAAGYVRTTTLKAFTAEEFAALLERLP